MIAHLAGTVRHVALDKVIVEVGGVGLAVSVAANTSSQINIGAPIQLFTSLVVREDSLTLFGFLDKKAAQLLSSFKQFLVLVRKLHWPSWARTLLNRWLGQLREKTSVQSKRFQG